jgi:hypothetical protein
MKKIVITSVLFSLSVAVLAQQEAEKKKSGLFGKVSSAVNAVKGGGSPLSTDEIVSGLKEALSVGANNSTGKLSAADGFLKDAAVKLLMPPEAQKVEKTLRSVGAGKLVDDAILSLNRAAEDASKSAAPIFLGAIKNMSIQDALGILKGTDTAATSYLRGATSAQLTAAFKPIIDASLEKVGATKYWTAVFEKYNKLPTTFNKVNTDLSGYATQKALDGIFYYVADEEKKIRTNPAARVTDILKKVFNK